MIGCNGSPDWPEHKIPGQQKEKIAEGQQKPWPLTFLNVDQVQMQLALHDGDHLTGPQALIAPYYHRVTIFNITFDLYVFA